VKKLEVKTFDPATLSKISNLSFRARYVVEGTLAGIHKSPHKGSSIEFLEHKEYSPGDEIRHIDWKVLGRSDKYYLKQFEDETNLRAYLLLDTSGSMGYGSGAMTKLEYATTLAACLCYLLLMQSDAVGLLLFGEGVEHYVPPRAKSNHLQVLLEALHGLKARGRSQLAQILRDFAEKDPRRSLIVLLSDLFDDIKEVSSYLKQLRQRNNEVVLFQILDSYELEFPFGEMTLFQSMEDTRQVLAEPRAIKEAYQAELARFLEEIRQNCLENQIDHWLVNTSTPIDRALLRYLTTRERVSRILCRRT
jgi:uncharacterized protein (DUF58 family)